MRYKTVFAIVAILLVLWFVLQNSQAVPMRFLFWKISMSGILLFPLIFALGALTGWIGRSFYENKKG
jgi:uncharacterized integral membrane protein